MLIPSGVPLFIIFSISFAGLALIMALASYADLSYRGMGKTTLGFPSPRLLVIPKLQDSIEKKIYRYFYILPILFILLIFESQKSPSNKSIWYFWILDAIYVLVFCYGIFVLLPIIMKESYDLGMFIRELKEAHLRHQSETIDKISSNLNTLKKIKTTSSKP